MFRFSFLGQAQPRTNILFNGGPIERVADTFLVAGHQKQNQTMPETTVPKQGFTIDGDTRDEPKEDIGDDEDADNYFRGRAIFATGVVRLP